MSKIEEHPRFRQAHTVLLYWSLPDEPDTHAFIEKYRDKKRIYLPVVVEDTMKACLYTNVKSMQTGSFNILEPSNKKQSIQPKDIDFILVPGTAFDIDLHRMGRGKGYYDRFLCKATKAFFLGTTFPFRILPDIPYEEHDVMMHDIIII